MFIFIKLKLLRAILCGIATWTVMPGALVASHADGLIAYLASHGNRSEISVMNDDGTVPTRLITALGHDGNVTLSPNGDFVVFSRYGIGSNPAATDIYRVNIDGTGLTQLTFDGLSYAPTITPNGQKIGYWNHATKNTRFLLMNPDGTGKSPLGNSPLDTFGDLNYRAAFSPDGTKIAFNRAYLGSSTHVDAVSLCIVNVDGSGFKELTSEQVYSVRPAWSPDGSTIAFERFSSSDFSKRTIFTMRANGSQQKSLGLPPLSFDASYSPDGKKLAFTYYKYPDFTIGVANADGSDQHTITAGAAYGPSWSNGHLEPGQSEFSILSASLKEGDSGQTTLEFPVHLNANRSAYRRVDYQVIGNSAQSGGDFVPTQGTLNFAPGVSDQSISVPILGDTLNEADEKFFVVLSNPEDATLKQERATGTILNDDKLSRLRVTDTTVTEGDEGDQYAYFEISLDEISGQTVSVNYQTEVGGAPKATPLEDYLPLSLGKVTFAPGERQKIVRIPIVVDSKIEKNEQFALRLSGAVNAQVARSVALCTIVDDDGSKMPNIAVSDASVVEGNTRPTRLTFILSLSHPTSHVVKVSAKTTPDEGHAATPGEDYRPLNGETITFAPGQTTRKVYVDIRNDDIDEPNETLQLALYGPSNGTLFNKSALGTIIDDDPPLVSVTPTDSVEGNGEGASNYLTFTLSLSAPAERPVSVEYLTEQPDKVGATAYLDYTPLKKSRLTFAPGETRKAVKVKILGDDFREDDEAVDFKIVNTSFATFSKGVVTAYIKNDDSLPLLSGRVLTKKEGNAGSTTFQLVFKLSEASIEPVTVHYQSKDYSVSTPDRAQSGVDYLPVSGSLTFAPGVTTMTVPVRVLGDTEVEADEKFAVVLSDPVGAVITSGTSTAVILNDDSVPQAVQAEPAPSGQSF